MATTTWSSCISHIIMSTLLCHVYEDHTVPLSGKHKVDYFKISPAITFFLVSCQTAITFFLVSPNPMSASKPIILLPLRTSQRTYSKKSSQIEASIFESKGQSTLVMTFYPNFMEYTW